MYLRGNPKKTVIRVLFAFCASAAADPSVETLITASSSFYFRTVVSNASFPSPLLRIQIRATGGGGGIEFPTLTIKEITTIQLYTYTYKRLLFKIKATPRLASLPFLSFYCAFESRAESSLKNRRASHSNPFEYSISRIQYTCFELAFASMKLSPVSPRAMAVAVTRDERTKSVTDRRGEREGGVSPPPPCALIALFRYYPSLPPSISPPH